MKYKNLSSWHQHVWIEMENKKIDPTIAQFRANKEDLNYVEKVKKKYSPQEYLNLCKEYSEESKGIKNYLKKSSQSLH